MKKDIWCVSYSLSAGSRHSLSPLPLSDYRRVLHDPCCTRSRRNIKKQRRNKRQFLCDKRLRQKPPVSAHYISVGSPCKSQPTYVLIDSRATAGYLWFSDAPTQLATAQQDCSSYKTKSLYTLRTNAAESV
jgi:hypothetical protein